VNDIELCGRAASGLGRLEARRVGYGLARLSGQTQVGLARIEAQADLQALRADAVAHVGQRAMQGVAMLSQLEQQLTQLVPVATSRLQAIGDMAALGMASIVGDTVRRLDRC
jgi:hypothetical protein